MATIDVHKVAPGKGDLAFSPYIHIYLSGYSSDSDGRALMSPNLMNDREIDEAVDYLAGQLEKARKTAKQQLKKIKK